MGAAGKAALIVDKKKGSTKMKKHIVFGNTLLLSLGMMAGCCLAEQPSATAWKAKMPITVDGDLSEWKLDSPIEINDASQVIRDADYWLGETDLSASIYTMWDEENLYLAADVKEASPFGAVGQLSHNMEDNMKLYISTNPDADPERESYETNDFLLYLMMDNQGWYTAFDRSMLERENLARFTSAGMEESADILTGYQHGYQFTDDGYILEIAIPWSNFSNDYIEQYCPQSGDTVNFDFVVTDNDYPLPNTQASVQMSWCGSKDIDKNPSLWGRLTFEE